MSGEGFKLIGPPSPSITIFPHLRTARIAVLRAAGLAEHSTALSTPMPFVSERTCFSLSGPAVSTSSQRFRFFAMSRRSLMPSTPMILRAPRALQSAAAASPTGPRPVMSTASLPEMPIFSRPSYTVPKPQATCAPSAYVSSSGRRTRSFSSARRYPAMPPSRCQP